MQFFFFFLLNLHNVSISQLYINFSYLLKKITCDILRSALVAQTSTGMDCWYGRHGLLWATQMRLGFESAGSPALGFKTLERIFFFFFFSFLMRVLPWYSPNMTRRLPRYIQCNGIDRIRLLHKIPFLL